MTSEILNGYFWTWHLNRLKLFCVTEKKLMTYWDHGHDILYLQINIKLEPSGLQVYSTQFLQQALVFPWVAKTLFLAFCQQGLLNVPLKNMPESLLPAVTKSVRHNAHHEKFICLSLFHNSFSVTRWTWVGKNMLFVFLEKITFFCSSTILIELSYTWKLAAVTFPGNVAQSNSLQVAPFPDVAGCVSSNYG